VFLANDEEVLVTVSCDVVCLNETFGDIKNARRDFAGPNDKIVLPIKGFEPFLPEEAYQLCCLLYGSQHIFHYIALYLLWQGLIV